MVNSAACAAVLRRKGVGAQRLHLVHNAVPPERLASRVDPETLRARLGWGADALVFGCVANDSKNKGVDALLRAFAAAGLRDARLLVVGVTPELWSPLARELGIAERVALIEPCEHVADYLRLCDVFALASRSESMPNTLQEAMRLGLPVVATAVGGVPECVDGNGLLVASGDEAGLARALTEAAASATRRAQWSARSLELGELFDPLRKLDRVESLYRQMFARRGLPWA